MGESISTKLSVPKALLKMDTRLQEMYLKLTSMCLQNLPLAEDFPDSDQRCASLKVPVGKVKRLVFVQFKPNRSFMKVQIHIPIDKINDPKKICSTTMPSYPKWSAFYVYPCGNDLDYYFDLIKQAYKEIVSRSNVSDFPAIRVHRQEQSQSSIEVAIEDLMNKNHSELMSQHKAKSIITYAVETTRPRWSQYGVSYKDLDQVFLSRGYEQQGFEAFKFTPLLKQRGLFSVSVK